MAEPVKQIVPPPAEPLYSYDAIARRISLDSDIDGITTRYRVSRVFALGLMPTPPQVAGCYAVPESWIPQLVEVLHRRGYLTEPGEVLQRGPQAATANAS